MRVFALVVVVVAAAGCRDKQLDFERAKLVRQLAEEQAVVDERGTACKRLVDDAQPDLPAPLAERLREIDAKPKSKVTVAELQEASAIESQRIKILERNIDALARCRTELPKLRSAAAATEAAIADIDKIQAPPTP